MKLSNFILVRFEKLLITLIRKLKRLFTQNTQLEDQRIIFCLLFLFARTFTTAYQFFKDMSLLALGCMLLASLDFSQALYTEETPVKLLQVESLAARYPASNSTYRVSLENGFVRTEVVCTIISVKQF